MIETSLTFHDLKQRAHLQLEFAGRFAKMRGDSSMLDRVAKSNDNVSTAEASESPDALRSALEKMESDLADIGYQAKKMKIHCIGHAHIDMNFLWSWPETVATTIDTFAAMLKLMHEYPAFRFSQSQGAVYEIIRKFAPEMLDDIRNKIEAGQWENIASQWVEGDKNMASGESLARHLYYTRKWCKQEFGLNPDDILVDWQPDTFGHSAMVPSILNAGGVRWYYLNRPGQRNLPPVFRWRSPDGGEVLVYRDTNWYNEKDTYRSIEIFMNAMESHGLDEIMFCYGCGDHGGGPTRRGIRDILKMNSWPIFPDVFFSTVAACFRSLEQKLDEYPVIDHELNFEFSGCLTSQSVIKRNHRHGENMLLETEAAFAQTEILLNRKSKQNALDCSWEKVLFAQFHDILPGSCLPPTRTHNDGQFQEMAAELSVFRTQALRSLCSAIDTSEVTPEGPLGSATALSSGVGVGTARGGVSTAAMDDNVHRTFVVFNSTAFDRNECVRFKVWDTGKDYHNLEGPMRMRVPDGTLQPVQRVDKGMMWGHSFVEVTAPVSVPAFGYKAVCIEPGVVPGYEPKVEIDIDTEGSWLLNQPRGKVVLENKFLRVAFDRNTGGIVSLLDKQSGVDVADSLDPLGILEYALERPHGMSAWVIGDSQFENKRLELVQFFTHGEKTEQSQRTLFSDQVKPPFWPHEVYALAKLKINDSTVWVKTTLNSDTPGIQFKIYGEWLERGGPEIGVPRLNFCLPLALEDPSAKYEIPFGGLEREGMNGREVPALRWASVTGMVNGKEASCVLVNESKYGHALRDSEMRLTLIRSSYGPDPLPEIGEFEIGAALHIRSGKLKAGEAMQLGAAFNQPLQPVPTNRHKGNLPPIMKMLESENPHVQVQHCKPAESGDGLIVRLLNTSSEKQESLVKIHRGTFSEAVGVDFLESPCDSYSVSFDKKVLKTELKPFGFASILLKK